MAPLPGLAIGAAVGTGLASRPATGWACSPCPTWFNAWPDLICLSACLSMCLSMSVCDDRCSMRTCWLSCRLPVSFSQSCWVHRKVTLTYITSPLLTPRCTGSVSLLAFLDFQYFPWVESCQFFISHVLSSLPPPCGLPFMQLNLMSCFSFRRHCWQATLPIGSDVTVPWSVCVSVCLSVCLCVCLSITFMHCAQTAEDTDTISFAYNSSMTLQIMLKFGLHRSTSSSPNFGPKWPTPCWFEHWRHSMADCSWLVRDSTVFMTIDLTERIIWNNLIFLYYPVEFQKSTAVNSLTVYENVWKVLCNLRPSQCSTLVRNTVVRATFKVNGKPPILGSRSPLTL